ncbi:ribonuclease H-like protein, partial [Coprinopsis marcescibilis]
MTFPATSIILRRAQAVAWQGTSVIRHQIWSRNSIIPSLSNRRPLATVVPSPIIQLKRMQAQQKPLEFDDGPLVWVDLEMTGLKIGHDKIIEVAVLITNGNLELVDEGLQFVVRTEKKYLDGMDDWCTKQHGQSGLTQACLNSPHSKEYVAETVLNYIKKWIPRQRVGVLAGNSVHVDRAFLSAEMPEVADWLHYRIVDVSSIKELSRRWFPGKLPPKHPESSHRALDDIRGSIRELKWYRENIFIPPTPGQKTENRNVLRR